MSDFLESARSTGVIGISLIIFLLIGFGALFLAVFDDRLNGENASRLKSQVFEQRGEIYGLEQDLAWAESALLAQKRIEVVQEEVDKNSKVLEVLSERETVLKEGIAEEEKTIQHLGEEKIAYREKYRVYSRKKAIGETFEEITLASGKVLRNAKIREILPDKIRFSTEHGTASVRWGEFADDMRERFQIGEGELEAYQSKMKAMQTQRMQLAAEGQSDHALYLREMDLKRNLSQIERTLREKTGKRDMAKIKLASLQAKATRYRERYNSASRSAYYSDYGGYYSSSSSRGKGYLNAAIRTEKEASTLSGKISVADTQIRVLEKEKSQAESELHRVKVRR